MSHNTTADSESHTASSSTGGDSSEEADDLQARITELEAENQRLRDRYTETRQQTYRRTALGLGGVGVITAGIAVLVPSAQQILFVLAGIGFFGAVLTWFLTPEQFIPVDIGDAVYEPLASNLDALTGELGLSGARVYVETDRGSRLYIPEIDTTHIPEEFHSTFVIGNSPETSGLALQPTGSGLVDEFEQTHTGPLPDTPRELTTHLIEGLVDGFELATDIDPDIATDDNQIVFEITNPAFGPLSRFDHPVQSFLAVGLTRGLEAPIAIETVETDEETARVCVTWETTQ